MNMRITPVVALLLLGSVPALAEGECKACVREKLDGAAAKVAAGAALGAIGGAKGLLPGAVCGAVLGAVTVGIDKLFELAQCESICKKEANTRNDPQKNKCEDLMSRVK